MRAMTQPAPPTLPTGPQQQPANWDVIAPGYLEVVVPHASQYAADLLATIELRPTDRVLDVASGPGTVAFVLAPRVGRVDAVDFSPAMIEGLRAKAARDGVTNVHGAVMDAHALDFPDATFDAAFCFFA